MQNELTIASLRRAYASGDRSPVDVAQCVLRRIAEADDDAIWISRVADDELLEAARRLAEDPAKRDLPLYGIPFAVKDNIDAAGLPTTAGCPAFAYRPARSATVVERLTAAGALLVGKTNLDQFATGLVGVRSPYGTPRNPFDAAYVPGGSSSGSAVAVARRLVAFSLGTDTAGSGRVPAAFNGLVGWKPTRGLVSTRGVVPACRSLDCVSVFTHSVADAAAVAAVVSGSDPDDAFSRAAPLGHAAIARRPERFTFAMPRRADLEFFGDGQAERLFDAAAEGLAAIGGIPREIDFGPFADAAALLYEGPWVAERTAAVGDLLSSDPLAIHPVTRVILESGLAVSAVSAFRAFYRLEALRKDAAAIWQHVDALLVPTTGTIYRVDELAAEPILLNSRLGRYTNFTNLFDLAGLALPAGLRANGLPFGVTLLAPAFHDPLLAAIGAAYLGEPDSREALSTAPFQRLAVVGAHLAGEPLNGVLVAHGARFRTAARTAPGYRLYALPDRRRPALVRSPQTSATIEAEVWDLPTASLGAFAATIAPPLGLGTIELADGERTLGFIASPDALEGALEITDFGGWRAWKRAAAS